MTPGNVLVLLRWRDTPEATPGDTVVHAVLPDRDALERRLGRVQRANPQYQLEQLSENFWRIGPDEDPGFFGDKPMFFRVVEVMVDV